MGNCPKKGTTVRLTKGTTPPIHQFCSILLHESWYTPRFGTKSIAIHHCNGCHIRRNRQRTPPAILFADYLVIYENTHEQAEEQLGLWRKAIENKGLRVSRSKTEYLPPSFCQDSKVKLGGEAIKNVTTFKYLGSMFDAEGGSTTDCKNIVLLAWNKCREVTGVICDNKVPVKLKHNIYKTVLKPTITYGAECWTMKKKDEMLMNKNEMRMLRWTQGVSLRDHKRNEEIREAATVQPITTHLMQKRLRWYGHVRRRDESHITRTVLDTEVEGVRPTGRPQLRYMDTTRPGHHQKRYEE